VVGSNPLYPLFISYIFLYFICLLHIILYYIFYNYFMSVVLFNLFMNRVIPRIRLYYSAWLWRYPRYSLPPYIISTLVTWLPYLNFYPLHFILFSPWPVRTSFLQSTDNALIILFIMQYSPCALCAPSLIRYFSHRMSKIPIITTSPSQHITARMTYSFLVVCHLNLTSQLLTK